MYVDLKLLSKEINLGKLTLYKRVNIFISYFNKTIKQFKVYTPDLGYIIKCAKVNCNKNIIRKAINLKIRKFNL